jgi:hypothetical protein
LQYRISLKNAVAESKMQIKRKLENFARSKEASRKDFYGSRVSLNQSVIIVNTNKIFEKVQRESELLERLKNT